MRTRILKPTKHFPIFLVLKTTQQRTVPDRQLVGETEENEEVRPADIQVNLKGPSTGIVDT